MMKVLTNTGLVETDDSLAFQFDFDLDAVEGKSDTVEVLDDGDLIIEGWASVFDGIDREGENFMDGAFDRGVKSFLGGHRPLCFHHKKDHVLGEVVSLEPVEGKGLKMRARVDRQVEGSPLWHIYNGIKKGSMKGLSVGGYFRRKLTEAGPRIFDVDLTEVSVTATPCHPGTNFAVVAGKALEDLRVPDGVTLPDVEGEIRAEDEETLMYAMQALENVFSRIGKRKSDTVTLA